MVDKSSGLVDEHGHVLTSGKAVIGTPADIPPGAAFAVLGQTVHSCHVQWLYEQIDAILVISRDKTTHEVNVGASITAFGREATIEESQPLVRQLLVTALARVDEAAAGGGKD